MTRLGELGVQIATTIEDIDDTGRSAFTIDSANADERSESTE